MSLLDSLPSCSIFISGSLGYLLGSYITGRIYDRVPGHRVMSGVLVLLGISVALVPLATSLSVLLLIILIAGFAKGAIDVGGNTLILWVHHERRSEEHTSELQSLMRISY